MTTAPAAERLTFDDLADVVQVLRQRGLRLSAPRRLVLEALFAAEGPASADQLARRAKLDPASVYRNLETFERHGVARHVHLGHGPGLYVLVGRGENEYLYCERCGAVHSLAPGELDPVRTLVRTLFGYEAGFGHHAIVGTCAACLAQPEPHRHPAGH
jgi:Fur family transcriptional regulator, ferric uptake regulator